MWYIHTYIHNINMIYDFAGVSLNDFHVLCAILKHREKENQVFIP